jgi:heme/copper-type cytochrome/quinol oxidase subunit 2
MVVLTTLRTTTNAKTAGLRAVALALAAAFCLLQAAGPGPENDPEKPDRVIAIVAERYSFVPSQIKLKQGEVVELRIRSLDTNHGFYIREAGLNVIVPKRGKGDVRVLFRAQRKGLFPFECSKACGAGHTMMRGRIIVE